jgi:hypothetical protein
MAIWKFWLDVFREIVGLRGGLVVLKLLLNNEKGASPLNFQSNEPFSMFVSTPKALLYYI